MAVYARPLILLATINGTNKNVSTIMLSKLNDEPYQFVLPVGFLGGTGPAFAKDVDGNPANGAQVEAYTGGVLRSKTVASSSGVWTINNLDPDKIYDIVGRYSTYDAVISRDRQPKLMELVLIPILEETRGSFRVYRYAIKNFIVPFSINVNGNPITYTADQDTGIIEISVGFDSTSYNVTITDKTIRVYNFLVVAPSP